MAEQCLHVVYENGLVDCTKASSQLAIDRLPVATVTRLGGFLLSPQPEASQSLSPV